MVMGCIRENQLAQANALLQSIASQHSRSRTRGAHISGPLKLASGNSVITLDINPTRELSALHESIVNIFQPLLTQDADEAAINDLPPISSDAIAWINHYIPDQCFDNFWPHITLGFGDPPSRFQPISFRGSRLAICHLGNYCTCRTILAEAILKP